MPGAKILIVDDDQDLLRGLSIRLKANGYTVVFATDGLSAISVGVKEKPDLIILDLGLPAGDGFSVMERLGRNSTFVGVPIVVLSARDPAANEERAFKSGAVAFLQKPVDNDVLLDTIKKSLGVF